MALNFTNQSRSYDATRLAVRFWGYDASLEASFFVTQDALGRLAGQDVVGESQALVIFDANRSRIQEVAGAVYGRGHKGSYELVARDF
jgi:hypothetical protein